MLILQGGGGGGGGDGGSYGLNPWFYPLPHCAMITVDIIGCNCRSSLALFGIGIMETQVESVVNGMRQRTRTIKGTDDNPSYPSFLSHLHLHSVLPYLLSYPSSSHRRLCRYCCSFRLYCELVGWLTIVKYQALEIIYRANAGEVERVVGEGKIVSCRGARTKVEVHKRKLTKNMFLHSDFLTSLSSSLTKMYFTIRKLVLRDNGVKR